MPKKEIVTPPGELVLVRRRAWPWPNFTTPEGLEAIGMSKPAAAWLGKEPRGDLAVTGLIGLPFLLAFGIGSWAILAILTLALAVFLLVFYLALPWSIEVVYDGKVVESEAVAGSVKAKHRVDGVAELYQTGAVRLPAPPPPAELLVTSALPVPGRLPQLKDRDLDLRPSLRDLDEESSLPSLTTEPEVPLVWPTSSSESVLPSPTGLPLPAPKPTPALELAIEVKAPPRPPTLASSEESPLRRAIRLVEEEESVARAAGLLKSEVDKKQAEKAKPKQAKPGK